MASSCHPLPKLGSGLPRFGSGFPCHGKHWVGISVFWPGQVSFRNHTKLHHIFLKTQFTPTCCWSPGPVSWTPGISCTNKYVVCEGCCCSCKKSQLRQGVTGTLSAASIGLRLRQPTSFLCPVFCTWDFDVCWNEALDLTMWVSILLNTTINTYKICSGIT